MKPSKQDKIGTIQADELVLALIADYKKQVDFDNCTFLSPATKKRINDIERGLVQHIDKLLAPPQPRKPSRKRESKPAAQTAGTVIAVPSGLQHTSDIRKRGKRG